MYRLSFVDKIGQREVWHSKVEKIANRKTLKDLNEFWKKQNPKSNLFYGIVVVVCLIGAAAGPIAWPACGYAIRQWFNSRNYVKFL